VNQDQFYLNPDGRPQVVAGVPPDYFSATGQLWGNPIYRWDKMAAEGYRWWIERIRGALQLFDRIRIDHFRGFESYWEVPGDAKVASSGRWAPGPRAALFRAAREALGPLPVIAEDLGLITPEVDALRDELGFPGMRVLQFAFGDDPKSREYQPHSYPRDCLCYTGTHDNDTTVGWFASQAGEGTTREQESINRERNFALRYMNSDRRAVHWDMIRLAVASVANTAIFPMQDLLGLGNSARMNLPGTTGSNWSWRFRWEQVTPEIEDHLRDMTETYDRV
jgi:4-alpha-glucanotransferase